MSITRFLDRETIILNSGIFEVRQFSFMWPLCSVSKWKWANNVKGFMEEQLWFAKSLFYFQAEIEGAS